MTRDLGFKLNDNARLHGGKINNPRAWERASYEAKQDVPYVRLTLVGCAIAVLLSSAFYAGLTGGII